MGNLVVINDLSEAKGGASALALRSAFALCEQGWKVTYIAGDAGRNDALSAAGVSLIGLGRARLTASHPARALIDGIYNRAAARLVSGWIAENDTPGTIYHLHGWAQILSPAIFAALRPVRERLLMSAHDFFLACPNGSFSFLKTGAVCERVPLSLGCIASNCDRRSYSHKLWRVVRQSVQRQLCDPSRSPPVLVLHDRMRPLLARAGIPPEAIITLPNPIRPFSDSRIPAEQNRTLLFVGRLEDTKGADLALAAARKAGATLRVIGDGPRRADLQAAYPEMIFMGFLDAPAIAEQARHARMLLMPSRYPEPYGLVAVEALWSGLPVVLSDTALLAWQIIEAGAGVAVDPRDTDAFAKVIAQLTDDDSLVAAMSVNAFDATRHIGLTDAAWIARLADLYAERLASAQARPSIAKASSELISAPISRG